MLLNVLMGPMETLQFSMKLTKSTNLTERQLQVSTTNTLLELLLSIINCVYFKHREVEQEIKIPILPRSDLPEDAKRDEIFGVKIFNAQPSVYDELLSST